MTDNLKWMGIGALALLAVLYLSVVVGGGEYFDSICVEGRLSSAQAQEINAIGWEKCPGYRQRQRNLGEDKACQAEELDRVIDRECSATLRALTFRDVDFF